MRTASTARPSAVANNVLRASPVAAARLSTGVSKTGCKRSARASRRLAGSTPIATKSVTRPRVRAW